MAKASTPTRPRGPFGSAQSDMPPGTTRTRWPKSTKAKGVKSNAAKANRPVGRRERDRQP
jgi:hypothetical protein